MAKHYANLRINHDNEPFTATTKQPSISGLVEKPTTEVIVFENKIKTCDSLETQSVPNTHAETKKSLKKTAHKPTPYKKTLSTTNTCSKKTTPLVKNKKRIKIRIPGSAQKEMTIDDWGTVGLIVTGLAFIAAIIVTGSFLQALLLAWAVLQFCFTLIAIGAIIYAIGWFLWFISGGFLA